MIPGVIYGQKEPVHFTVSEKELGKLVYTPHVYLIQLSINGDSYLCTMKDIQFHPVTDKILHVDLLEINEKEPIKIRIPVKLEGFAEGVQQGGKLKLETRRPLVRGLVNDLPDELKVDVTRLSLGKSIKIKDLTFEGLELLDNKDAVVASVKLTRVAKGMALEEEAATEEGEEAEGEEGAEESGETAAEESSEE